MFSAKLVFKIDYIWVLLVIDISALLWASWGFDICGKEDSWSGEIEGLLFRK